MHYVASNIPIFFKNAEFVCSFDKYQPLSVAREQFLVRKGRQKI